jgi:hypothetical protein
MALSRWFDMSKIYVDEIRHSGGAVAAINIDSSGRVDMDASYVFDQWYLNANHTTDGDSDITSWSQTAFTGLGKVSGMSHSSGIFTFPQTGLYKVTGTFLQRDDASDNFAPTINVTTDNSSYTEVSELISGSSGNVNGGSVSSSVFVNVTDIANVKVKFRAKSMDTNSYIWGASDRVRTNVMFERLAPAQ